MSTTLLQVTKHCKSFFQALKIPRKGGSLGSLGVDYGDGEWFRTPARWSNNLTMSTDE